MKETYGENIKTVSVLMGHASSAYTLDLYAAYAPNTGIGIGKRYMSFLRAAAQARARDDLLKYLRVLRRLEYNVFPLRA